MLRNITLSAEEQLISRAREKAVAAQTTLNPQAAWPFPTASKP